MYDVIVVGLGAMGSATLYQLAKRGVRALGIDRYDPPHARGSTHGETRVTRLAVGEGPQYMPLVRRSHDIWRELEAQTGAQLLAETGGTIVCPVGGGSWHHGRDFVETTIQLAKSYDIPHERLNNAQLAERRPFMKLRGNEHAILEHTAGIALAENAVRTQLHEAERLGATIMRNTTVLSVADVGAGVAVATDDGVFSAEKAILTAGPWIGDLIPKSHQSHFQICRQVIYWFEVEDLSSFSGDRFPWLIWIGDTLEEYMGIFPHFDYEEHPKAVKVLTEQFLDNVHPSSVQREVSKAEIDDMHDRLLAPRVHGFTNRCISAATCLYTMTADDHFIIDQHPTSERITIASPGSGHGFKHSAAIGEGLAELAATGVSRHDFSSFRFGRS